MQHRTPEASGVFNRMFLFTTHPCDLPGWIQTEVAEYHLYTHPNLTLTSVAKGGVELFLLGYLFDYRVPERSNADILKLLLECAAFEDMLRELDECSGRAVLICRDNTSIYIVTDACAQREIFYDTTFSAFGSQPKLIEKVVTGKEWTDVDAKMFYQSPLFMKTDTYVGDTTHRANIKRLKPNHFADIRTKTIHRYFPLSGNVPATIASVVPKVIEMLRGYLRAASLRYPLDLGVTAGYDSRLLFLASLDLPCRYFVISDYGPGYEMDIDIAKDLVDTQRKQIEIWPWHKEITSSVSAVHEASVDFPRRRQMKHLPSDRMIINGHVSEVARNYFGYDRKLSGAKLAMISAHGADPFVSMQYEQWLSGLRPYLDNGFHLLDLFYWEERMPNWSAKGKTEAALYVEIYSPFNSRRLLTTLLSTPRKSRDKHLHKLYDTVISAISPEALHIPINPSPKFKRTRFLKRLRVFKLYLFGLKKYKMLRRQVSK